MERIKSNSLSLEEHFPNIYRDFYANNDLVLSGNFSMSWWPSGILHRSNYIRMKSKVPLKCYIGVTKRKDTQVRINTVTSYEIAKRGYETLEYTLVNSAHEWIILEIQTFLKEQNYNFWVDINFLSETSKWHGFGFSWVSWSLIVTALYMLTEKINTTHLEEDYNTFLNSPIFHEIALFSWKLDMISTYGNTAWHGALNVFHKTSIPSYVYTEKFDASIDISSIWEIKRYFHIITDKFNRTSITSDIGVDYGIIFSWVTTDTKKVEEFKKWQIKKHNSYSDFVKNELFTDEVIEIENIAFWKYIDESSIFNTLKDVVGIVSIQCLHAFKKLLDFWYDDKTAEELIDVMNNFRHVTFLMEKHGSFADDFLFQFHSLQKNREEKMGIVPIYWGKLWWGYLVVLKHGISINTLENTLGALKDNYPNIAMEYCSYIDGFCNDGVMIEQFISQWIYSKYIDKNKVIYTDNKGNRILWDYSSLIQDQSDWLLFDMINSKIYLNGEKLTSKDIPSQNTTIEVVTKLLENLWEEVSNKEFSASSYVSNKNEMSSKIILPLLKLVEEKTSEQLSMVCKWSTTDFYLKMWKINLKIGIIKKIS